MSEYYPDSNIRVAAVCGREVRIYGEVTVGRRFFIRKEEFSTHGAARLFAQEYEDRERQSRGTARV